MSVVVIVGTEKGAFVCRSDARRRDWQIEGPLFKGWKVTASNRSPSGRYLIATASQVYGAALHAGTDLKSWKQIESGPAYPPEPEPEAPVAADPDQAWVAGARRKKLNQIWTIQCGSSRHYAGVDTAGLFSSDDDGETWQPVSALNDHPTRRSWFPGAGGLCAHSVLVDRKQPERIWCAISAVGVWRSDDGGKSWVGKNEGVRCICPDKEFTEIGYCVHGLAQDPNDANTIFRQDHTGMYRTRDGGDHWERIENGLASWFGFPIAIDPHTRTLFAFPMESDEYRLPVGGKFRVYRSRDGGDSWEGLGRGLPEQLTYAGVLRGAMAVDGLDPAGVYVGSTAGEVFASADGGDSWQELPCTVPRVLSVRAYRES
jgi:photosystem II stability/assembly factor-like uncharacterized protein